jgi:hypothetical protein
MCVFLSVAYDSCDYATVECNVLIEDNIDDSEIYISADINVVIDDDSEYSKFIYL